MVFYDFQNADSTRGNNRELVEKKRLKLSFAVTLLSKC